MPALFLPVTIENGGTLPSISFNDVSILKEFEPNATDHWIFDKGNSSCLTGIKAGSLLTVAGSTAPTYNSKNVTLANVSGSQLISNVSDQLSYTVCIVNKVPILGTYGGFGQVLMSTLDASAGAMYATNGAVAIDFASRAIISGALASASFNTTDLIVGSIKFSAFSVNHAGSTKTRRIFNGTTLYEITDTAIFTPHATNKLALGGTTAQSSGTNVELYEFIIFAGQILTTSELVKVFNRSKARLLRRSQTTVV
jgi:hypothetical protein